MLVEENHLIIAAISLFIFGLLFGYLVAALRAQKKLNQLKEQNTRLIITLEVEKTQHAAFNQNQDIQKQQLNASFRTLSYSVLKQSNDTFLRLAKETLGKYQAQATSELEKKEDAFDALLKPIKETLEKTQTQIQRMENDRKSSYGALNQHLISMAETQKHLHNETRNLVKAFHRPEVRGQWGELTLKRLAELAGMVEYCDFEEQVSVSSDTGTLFRPDMIIRLPSKRDIVVDSKTPLDAYLDAVEAPTEQERTLALARHLKHVKQRIKELSAKAYWQQFDRTPDFVVLFIPGDQFLNAALDLDKNLIEYALTKKVILSTPTSFVALLRAIAYGWRQETMTENAEHIRILGEEMYTRFATFTEHLSNTGKSLELSVNHYNKTIATLSSRVIPSMKKFKEMGVETKKDIPALERIENKTRQLETDLID